MAIGESAAVLLLRAFDATSASSKKLRRTRSHQNRPIAPFEHRTPCVLATTTVIDPIAVADVESLLGAVPPNCVLDEPGKICRERRVELSCVDLPGDPPDQVGAATRRVAMNPIQMLSAAST
jgi:hypothetical protein